MFGSAEASPSLSEHPHPIQRSILTTFPSLAVEAGTERVARSDTSKQPMQYRRLAVGICRWDTSRGLGLSPLSRFGSGLGQGCGSDKGSVSGPRPGQAFRKG
jgi:hypothetical protein